eukprot:2325986-Rhodomonas_salina.1
MVGWGQQPHSVAAVHGDPDQAAGANRRSCSQRCHKWRRRGNGCWRKGHVRWQLTVMVAAVAREREQPLPARVHRGRFDRQ